jgi:ABC-type antimicrobial peptide transport system permease subunit
MPRVAIIEEAGARRLFGPASPLGRRFTYHQAIPETTIVGVVETAAARDFATPNERVGMYLPEAQDYTPPVVLLRTEGESEAVLKNVRASIAALDPAIRASVQPATAVYDEAETFSTPRFYLVLVSTFAVLAIVTAAVGLYGLLAHTVGHRRREIGVRIALGSTTGGIRWLVLRDALVPVAAGVAGGALVAWWAAGLIASQLYGIGPRDPRAFALASVGLVLAATLAALAPVRRATGMDPVAALRAE